MQLSTRAQTRELLNAEILAYLQTLPDYDRWKDFFHASTGKRVIDILTGISELLIYKLEIRGLDSYLPTAITEDATYLLAQMVGYNPNRKHSATGKVKLVFNGPVTTQFIIPKFHQFDYDKPLVVKDNVTVPAGVSEIDVEVLQGEWVSRTYQAPDIVGEDWEILKVDETDHSIDQFQFYVKVNGNNINTVDKIETIDSNSVIVRTDYKGGVFVLFGDGNYGYRLNQADIVIVEYLRTLGLDGEIDANVQLGTFSYANNVFNIVTSGPITGGSNQDSIEKVKYLASRFFQAQGRAVTAYDYEAVTMSYPGVISAKVVKLDNRCCTICLSALKQDHLDWNQTEIDSLLAYLDKYKMISTKIEFNQPEPVVLNIDVKVKIPPLYSNNTLETDIYNLIVDNYCYKLGGKFYPTQLVDEITDSNPGIIRSYITVNGDECYTDLDLSNSCNKYFKPGTITVSREVVVS